MVVSQPSEISAPFAPIQVSSSESLEPDIPLSLFVEVSVVDPISSTKVGNATTWLTAHHNCMQSKLHITSTRTSYIQVEVSMLYFISSC